MVSTIEIVSTLEPFLTVETSQH